MSSFLYFYVVGVYFVCKSFQLNWQSSLCKCKMFTSTIIFTFLFLMQPPLFQRQLLGSSACSGDDAWWQHWGLAAHGWGWPLQCVCPETCHPTRPWRLQTWVSYLWEEIIRSISKYCEVCCAIPLTVRAYQLQEKELDVRYLINIIWLTCVIKDFLKVFSSLF